MTLQVISAYLQVTDMDMLRRMLSQRDEEIRQLETDKQQLETDKQQLEACNRQLMDASRREVVQSCADVEEVGRNWRTMHESSLKMLDEQMSATYELYEAALKENLELENKLARKREKLARERAALAQVKEEVVQVIQKSGKRMREVADAAEQKYFNKYQVFKSKYQRHCGKVLKQKTEAWLVEKGAMEEQMGRACKRCRLENADE